jgi:hypothetical protein
MALLDRDPSNNRPHRPRNPAPIYIPPPIAFDNNLDEQVSYGLGTISQGGFVLSFSFAGNYLLTIPKAGTVLLGTGTAGAIPQLSDANTITDSNLRMTGSNVLTLTSSAVATLTAPYTGTISVPKTVALTPSAAITMNLDLGSAFTLTPDQSCAITPSGGISGQTYHLIITTSGTSSYTITFSSPFKVTGTLATGTTTAKVFVVTFVYDGTNVAECSRTTAM